MHKDSDTRVSVRVYAYEAIEHGYNTHGDVHEVEDVLGLSERLAEYVSASAGFGGKKADP